MPAEMLNRNPKPSALIIGLDDETADRVGGLFAHAEHPPNLGLIRQAEWDAIITDAGIAATIIPEIYVLLIGGDYGGPYDPVSEPELQLEFSMRSRPASVARELHIPNDLEPAVERLVRSDLRQVVEASALKWNIGPSVYSRQVGALDVSADFAPRQSRPFLSDGDGRCMAARFVRRGGHAETWWLPTGVDVVAWAAAALEAWHALDPQRFPAGPDAWVRDAAWETSAESETRRRLESKIDEHRAILAGLIHERDALASAFDEARAAGDARERRLLTAKGRELVVAVRQALEALGFSVEDMDEVWPDGDRREDLRVRDPHRPDWTAIAEVRGYVRGAQLTDLFRLQRFAARYERDEGAPPDAVWYIVNHLFEADPSLRDMPLQSNPAEVDEFGKSAGVVIDTVTLFKAWIAAESDHQAADEFRRTLVESKGRLDPLT